MPATDRIPQKDEVWMANHGSAPATIVLYDEQTEYIVVRFNGQPKLYTYPKSRWQHWTPPRLPKPTGFPNKVLLKWSKVRDRPGPGMFTMLMADRALGLRTSPHREQRYWLISTNGSGQAEEVGLDQVLWWARREVDDDVEEEEEYR